LNQLTNWWFEHTADILPNHVIDVPDPNVTIALTANPLPVAVMAGERHVDVMRFDLADDDDEIRALQFLHGMQLEPDRFAHLPRVIAPGQREAGA
jgi:hypothetical protein